MAYLHSVVTNSNQWLPMVTNHDDVDNDGGDVGDDDDDTVDDNVQ